MHVLNTDPILAIPSTRIASSIARETDPKTGVLSDRPPIGRNPIVSGNRTTSRWKEGQVGFEIEIKPFRKLNRISEREFKQIFGPDRAVLNGTGARVQSAFYADDGDSPSRARAQVRILNRPSCTLSLFLYYITPPQHPITPPLFYRPSSHPITPSADPLRSSEKII